MLGDKPQLLSIETLSLDPSDPLQQPVRGRPFTAPAPYTASGPPVDPGEDTSVEVRHEGPKAKKIPPRRSSFTSPTSPMNPHRRSRSIEVNEGQHARGGFVIRDDATTARPLSQTPSTLEEARDRIRVLSALTRIAGGRRTGGGGQAEQGSLKVSVVMQIDRRIERTEGPREEGLLDSPGGHHLHWGHSTGGL
jgi:hypothetical protein